MENLHIQKSRKLWKVLLFTVFFALIFDFAFLYGFILCDNDKECYELVVHKNFKLFGENVRITIFYSLAIAFNIFFGICSIGFFATFIIIGREFKNNYPEMYLQNRCRIILIMSVLVIHLIWRLF